MPTLIYFEDILNVEYELEDEYLVNVNIYDKYGTFISTLVSEKVQKGYNKVVWKGINSEGKRAKDGFYVVVFEFMDKNNKVFTEERKVLKSHYDAMNVLYSY